MAFSVRGQPSFRQGQQRSEIVADMMRGRVEPCLDDRAVRVLKGVVVEEVVFNAARQSKGEVKKRDMLHEFGAGESALIASSTRRGEM